MATSYAWLITKDSLKLDNFPSLVGIAGPRGLKLTDNQIRNHPKRERFRVLDDDGEIYYYGFFVDLDGHSSGFEPLYDYGTPSLGATEIQYMVGGKWRTL